MNINDLRLAFRNLLQHKTITLLNVTGLAVGIAVCLLLLNFIQFQRGYDQFHKNADRIFRVPMELQEKGGAVQNFAFTYPAVGPHLIKDFPEVEDMVRLRFNGGIAKRGEVSERVQACFADSSIFHIFSFNFIEGDPNTVFSQPYSAVLTQKMVELLFQQTPALGQSFNYRDKEWTVRGILEDLPVQSHLHLGMLLDYPSYVQISKEEGNNAESSWGWSDFYTYLLLRKPSDAVALQSKLPGFTERYMGEKMKKEGFEQRFFLQPMLDIHLKSNYDYELEGNGNFGFIYALGAAGLFILVIAWLNYVNLATARALDRAKEVAIRKVNGASNGQLLRLFLTESLMTNAMAILLGAVFFFLALKGFAGMVDRAPSELLPTSGLFWALLAGLFGGGALLSGLYPAWTITRFNATQAFKHKWAGGRSGTRSKMRKTLVLVQFSIATLLVTGALALYWQLEFMRRQRLGVDIQQTLVLEDNNMRNDSVGQIPIRAFLADARALAGVRGATASTSVPGREIGGSSDFRRQGSDQTKRCRIFGVDEQFMRLYGLELVAGAPFSSNFKNESHNCILNEKAVKVFGYSDAEHALGEQLLVDGEDVPYTITGVLRDYHQESLRHDYDPTVFYANTGAWSYYSIKMNTSDLSGMLAQITQLWKKHFPGTPLHHFFLDADFERQYLLDKMFGMVLLACTALALLVACLGLFGLSLFTVAKREKEIGIRKVLGASVAQVIALVTKEYLYLILMAAAITLPAAVWGVERILSAYAFRAELGIWFYVLPATLLGLIAFLTTVGQSMRVATSNPVNSLRSE